MKELIGKTISIQTTFDMKVKGILVEEDDDRLLLSQNDKDDVDSKIIAYVPKEQIGMILYKTKSDEKEETTKEPEQSLVQQNSGLLVLSLVDKKTHEPTGKYYITDGGDVQENVDLFLESSNLTSDNYAISVLGDLFELDHVLLKRLLASLILDTTGE